MTASMVEDRVWRALLTELKAWAIFVPSLILFSLLAALAIGGAITDILVDVDLPAAVAFICSSGSGCSCSLSSATAVDTRSAETTKGPDEMPGPFDLP